MYIFTIQARDASLSTKQTNLLSGFTQTSLFSSMLEHQDIPENVTENNKGADQNAQMHRLICTVVRK